MVGLRSLTRAVARTWEGGRLCDTRPPCTQCVYVYMHLQWVANLHVPKRRRVFWEYVNDSGCARQE
jgi:hypothetical protein